jgi:serine/threonine protein kinase
VSKATWKGTEVAVKVMASDKITKDMEKSFKDEVRAPSPAYSQPSFWKLITVMAPAQVRVMTALRHPNVVLFMAASTKAPKMCIVMEYMALGSLFDVLCSLPLPP